jgi:hypothetical protein
LIDILDSTQPTNIYFYRTELLVFGSLHNYSKSFIFNYNKQTPSRCLLNDLRSFLLAPALLPAALCLLCPSEVKQIDKLRRQITNITSSFSPWFQPLPGITAKIPPRSWLKLFLGYTTNNRTWFARLLFATCRICTCELPCT